MERKAKVIFIGGAGTGKSDIIKSLWGISTKKNKEITVSDDIPGRGIMEFSVVEMPPVVYSLKDYAPKGSWFNKDNINTILNADAIVFVLPAKSYGYDSEFRFLVDLFKKYLKKKNIPFTIVVSKIEQLKEKRSRDYGDLISGIYEVERYINNMFERYDLNKNLSISNIVPFSAFKGFNTYQLKTKIWDGVISHTNDYLFDKTNPTIIVSGKRGCGKSSTLNTLFGFNLPVDRAVACTKYPRVMKATLDIGGEQVEVNIVDLPGIAESIKADMSYYPFYKKYVEQADILLCLNQANVRAYKQDELFYKYLSESKSLTSKTRIIIAMNHVDSLFKDNNNLDGIELNTIRKNNPILVEKINDMFEKNYKHFFSKTHPSLSKECVIPISAFHNWHIDLLKDIIIQNLK